MSKYSLPFVSLSFLVVSGCAADATEDMSQTDEAPFSSAAAVYVVPTVDESLRPSATYPVAGGITWRVDGATAQLRYKLPAALVGEATSVTMSGALDPRTGAFELTGPLGTASCTTPNGSLVCNERLPGVRVDLAMVAQEVVGAPDAVSRLEVSRTFGTDPIGVFSVPLRRGRR